MYNLKKTETIGYFTEQKNEITNTYIQQLTHAMGV